MYYMKGKNNLNKNVHLLVKMASMVLITYMLYHVGLNCIKKKIKNGRSCCNKPRNFNTDKQIQVCSSPLEQFSNK